MFEIWLEKTLRKLYEEVKNPKSKICLYNSINNIPNDELIFGSFENMLPLFKLLFYGSLINGLFLIVEIVIEKIIKKYSMRKYRIMNIFSHLRFVFLL
jgi:hypothetical protein